MTSMKDFNIKYSFAEPGKRFQKWEVVFYLVEQEWNCSLRREKDILVVTNPIREIGETLNLSLDSPNHKMALTFSKPILLSG